MEFCHGVQVFPQPVPHRNKGGDCFACAMTAFLKWAFPEREIDFNTVWELFQEDHTYNTADGEKTTKILLNSWPEYHRIFNKCFYLDLALDSVADIPRPDWDPEQYSHNWHRTPQQGNLINEYHHMCEGYLRAGYVGYTSILKDGTRSPIDQHWETDHIVLIDGIRVFWKPHPTVTGAKSQEVDLHIVCSSAGGSMYWRSIKDLIDLHGIGSIWWIRKRATYPTHD